jgi:hypothetical protein
VAGRRCKFSNTLVLLFQCLMQARIMVAKLVRIAAALELLGVVDDVPTVNSRALVNAVCPLDTDAILQWPHLELQAAVSVGQFG